MKVFITLIVLLASTTLFAQENALFAYATLKTSEGDIKLKLFKDVAPRSVENFIGLATGSKSYRDIKTGERIENKPFYRNMIFHKVHPDLGIQTGCPWGNGKGWPGFTIKSEKNNIAFDAPFMVAMSVIEGSEHSAGSQFFITTRVAHHLANHYSVIGNVVSGFEVVKKISEAKHDSMMKPIKPIRLIEVVVD